MSAPRERAVVTRTVAVTCVPDGTPAELTAGTLVQITPQDAESHYLLALAYAHNDQEDAMLTALQQAVRLNPRHAQAHHALAAFYFQHQHYDLAWQHGTTAAQLGAPVQPLLEALRQIRGEGR